MSIAGYHVSERPEDASALEETQFELVKNIWSLMDNFSWINRFKKRYGLLYADRETLERRRKASSYWYQQVCAANGFDDETAVEA